jgi:hypothetical protein
MSEPEKKKLGRPKTGKARIFRAFRLPAELLEQIQTDAKENGMSEANVLVMWGADRKRTKETAQVFASAPETLRETVLKSTAAIGPTFAHSTRLADERKGAEPIPK